jgi:nucleotide-binding universal stress UspA family protein
VNDSISEFRRILVATDFSPCADAALHQAIWIAKLSHGKVVLAHVVADLRHAVSRTSYRSRIEFLEGQEEHFQRELRRDSDEKLRRAIHHQGDTGVNITYETLLGTPFVELIHSVQQEGYDLVVVGTRGNNAWQQLFLGSTARRLIRKCPAPVWIVKRKQAKPATSILVSVDMSDVSRRALEQAVKLAACASAELHVLHVVEHDIPDHLLYLKSANSPDHSLREWMESEATQNLDKFLAPMQTAGMVMHRHVLWGSPSEQIVNLAKVVDADVIALGTVGRSGIQGIVLGNTAENVLVHCECDVLTVKPAGFQTPIAPPTWSLHPGPERRDEARE